MTRAKGAKAFRAFRGSELPADHDPYQRQIDAVDRQIDALVYELYGLTDGEKMIVEERIREIWL